MLNQDVGLFSMWLNAHYVIFIYNNTKLIIKIGKVLSMIKVKMYQASQGDAFLISIPSRKINIVVDMGLKGTYLNHIKPDLINLKVSGQCIDLLVVTHVDNDHIVGAVNFIKDNGSNDEVIEVKEVWYNCYRHLQFLKQDKALDQDERDALQQICSQNRYLEEKKGLEDIQIEQGVTLAGLLYGYNYSWNDKFDGYAVISKRKVIEISAGLTLRIVSPNKEKLNALSTKWKEKLESEKYDFTLNEEKIFDDAFEQYMKMPEFQSEIKDVAQSNEHCFSELLNLEGSDTSITNGSSIAFIIEFENRKLLFLGDAHEDVIYDELSSLKDDGYDLDFEIVKVSHHGSNNNISNRLLKLISSKRFLISTNGSHSHPDLSAIAKIISNSQWSTIITNYQHEKLKFFENYKSVRDGKVTFITANEIMVE
ncbi:hypothetical protein [Rheinheimera soli]|uniref:hypothetical protein n=1 Tax=Rheinheimera soli TaxID=443616 RepID=UPI001E61A8A2|nr:hypothetical protein [Rheinheimera soli]